MSSQLAAGSTSRICCASSGGTTTTAAAAAASLPSLPSLPSLSPPSLASLASLISSRASLLLAAAAAAAGAAAAAAAAAAVGLSSVSAGRATKKATSGSRPNLPQSSPTVGSSSAYSVGVSVIATKDWNWSSVSWQRSYLDDDEDGHITHARARLARCRWESVCLVGGAAPEAKGQGHGEAIWHGANERAWLF